MSSPKPFEVFSIMLTLYEVRTLKTTASENYFASVSQGRIHNTRSSLFDLLFFSLGLTHSKGQHFHGRL